VPLIPKGSVPELAEEGIFMETGWKTAIVVYVVRCRLHKGVQSA